MKRILSIVALLLFAASAGAGVVAAQSDSTTTPPTNLSISDLLDSDGMQLGYAVVFQDTDGATGVGIVARGLTPGSHGVHIHETGNCDPAGEKTFEQAGAHFNPSQSAHPLHAGDLGNLLADEDGEAVFTAFLEDVDLGTVSSSPGDTDGLALVIHADADDLVTDPSGNSGSRIACAVIVPPAA